MLRILAAILALCAAGLVILDARHWRTGDRRHASFRTVVVSVLILLGLSVTALARPSPYPPPDQFDGDKYRARQTQLGPEVARSVKAKQGAKSRARYLYPTRKRPPVSQKQWRLTPMPEPRPLAEPGVVEPLSQNSASNDEGKRDISLGAGAWREAKRAVGRPARWCGWWLGQHLGMPLRELWLARNWAKVGSSAGGPRIGAIVVWSHHVGIITGRTASGWIVKSGNDGHAVRERPRSVAGAIAFRMPSS